MYTTKEAAQIFKCNVETIRRRIRRGEIKTIKIGRDYRIPDDEIERLKRGE